MRPEDLGRTDWHHNEKGEVDYLPIKNYRYDSEPIPLEKQKYDYGYEAMLEQGCRNLAEYNSRRIDWNDYNRNRAYD